MLDYLKWRGDLSWSASPLNELDALVFSQLSYLHFCDALGEQGARPTAGQLECVQMDLGHAPAPALRGTLVGRIHQPGDQ